ncbi:MAG TPA: permease prefix domain 1-containing protein [Pyrinomonadaceae bacterium]|nr:permease prefix domain 1-containing protein [Pyrinomonadaceae bacterium]
MKIAFPNLLIRRNRGKTAFEIEEELQFHIAMLERKYTQHGMPASEAKAAALKRFGNLERIKRQCVDISRRNSLLRRFLKTSSILIALTGLSIRILSSDYKVARIGGTLIMIAVAGRLLLYVRGLSPWSFFPRTKEASLSVVTETPKAVR